MALNIPLAFPKLKQRVACWNSKTDHDYNSMRACVICRVTSLRLTYWTYMTCTLFNLNQLNLNFSYYFLFMNVNMADNCMLNF